MRTVIGRVIDMISIDEAIKKHKKLKILAEGTNDKRGAFYSAEEHEQLSEWLEELKAIKELDLDIPQHFTKEQRKWIKSYCIKRNIEFYNKALDDFVNFANTMPTVEVDGEIRPMWLEEMAEQLKAGESE